MARKGENIYKRKDGRWEGRYKKGRKTNGQIKYGYIYGKTYTDVKHRLYAYKLKYQQLIQINGSSVLSYEEWGLLWLTQRQSTIKPSTYSTYFYKLKNYVFPVIGSYSLNQLSPANLQKLVNHWQEQSLKPTTIHVLYQIVKKSLLDATLQGYLLQTPCTNIHLPRKSHHKVLALTFSEQKSLEHVAKKSPLHKGLPILLALHTGMRIGEIAALKWTDINWNKRIINVSQTYQRLPIGFGKQRTSLLLDQSKTTGSIRLIPIGANLYKYLKRWAKRSQSAYVCSKKSYPAEPRLLTYYFHKIRQKCELTSIHFHQLRHTFATRCIEAKADIVSVSRLLGHASSQTTLDIYTDSLLETRQLIINRMNQLVC